MNNYAPPLQGTANSLAKHGRYGDSMLVHMNPIEVQGIAALSPTGKLTTNPVTGQQEAFLPFLAPLLGGALGLGSLGTAALSGALTALQTGDLKKGLLAGITGFGLGKVMGGLGSLGDAAKSATDAATATGSNIGTLTGTAAEAATKIGAEQAAMIANPTGTLVGTAAEAANQILANQAAMIAGTDAVTGGVTDAITGGVTDVATNVAAETPWYMREGKRLGDEGFFKDLSKTITSKKALPGLLMAGTAGSELGRLEAQEKLAAQLESDEMDASSDRAQSEEEIQRAINQRIYDYGMPSRGIDPLDSSYSPTAYANNGGLVSLNPMDYQNKRRGLAQLTGEPVRMANGGASPYPYGLGNYFGGQTGAYTPNVQASEAQSALRGSQLISAPQMQELYSSGYRPGFGPELQYFREPDQFGNDPFAGVIDPMNPNAAIIPTAEQLASLEETSSESDPTVPSSPYNNENYSFMPGKGNIDLSQFISPESTSVPPVSEPVDYNEFNPFNPTGVPVPPETTPEITVDSVDTSFNPYQDFDFSAFRNRLDALENREIPDYTTPDLSQFVTADQLNTRFSDMPTYDDTQLREDMNTRFGNFSNFDPTALQGRLDELGGRVDNIPQFDPSQLRDRLAELEERNMPRFGSDINNFRFNSGGITNLAEGGLVKMQDRGQVPEASIDPAMMQPNPMEEGIAAVDPAMANSAMADPAMGDPMAGLELMQQTAMAVLGRVPPEQADAIIQAFIQQFGPEAFQVLRQEVLASVEPNAQTEGMIEGQGDGMSDEIMGSIGDQQRVAVSPGEFIVPADVVSGIGNGSSDAGANELDSMMEEIRLARTGMAQQPPAIDPRGAMPV